jgi:hypothetical protein
MKKFIFAILVLVSCNSPYKITETVTIDSLGRKTKTIVKQYDTTRRVYSNYSQPYYYPYWNDPFFYRNFNRTIIVPVVPRAPIRKR